MNRLVVIVVGALLLAVGAGAWLINRRNTAPNPAPATADSAASVEPPAPAAAPPLPRVFDPDAPKRPQPQRPAEKPRYLAPNVPSAAKPAPSKADPSAVTLRVDSNVSRSQVFIDRNFIGYTPLTTADIKAGRHRLNVAAPGYEGVAQDLDLAPGLREVAVNLQEMALDARVAVVHKHRMGSCSGDLRASREGLRYETTNPDDGFSAGWTTVKALDVNTKESRLRVQLVSGKTYDFASAEGGADTLLVFQRAAEKAHARLQTGVPAPQ